MIRALICDLDNTLFPATAIPAEVLQPAVDALLAANAGEDSVDPAHLQRALAECWRRSFDEVALEFALPERLCRVFAMASADLHVDVPLVPYPDITALSALHLRRFLVTTGYRRFQESKIEALGIRPLFDAVFIDALDEPTGRKGKSRIFQQILAENGLSPHEAVVIGDSPGSEIEEGNRLGIPTIQVLRRGVTRTDRAVLHIRSFAELADALGVLEARAAKG